MPQPPWILRDYGLLPDDEPPPEGKIVGYYSTGRVIVQYLTTGLLLVAGLALAGLMLWGLPSPLGWVAAGTMACCFAVGAEIEFKKTILDPLFRSEGVAVADINRDGKLDMVVSNRKGVFVFEQLP